MPSSWETKVIIFHHLVYSLKRVTSSIWSGNLNDNYSHIKLVDPPTKKKKKNVAASLTFTRKKIPIIALKNDKRWVNLRIFFICILERNSWWEKYTTLWVCPSAQYVRGIEFIDCISAEAEDYQRVSWIWQTIWWWGSGRSPSLPLLPGLFWTGVVARDGVQSMDQI